MSARAVFESRDGRFVATELARGPWDPKAQHGGAPAALLMRAFEQFEGPPIARVTYEFVRQVPLAAVEVSAEISRSGRRVQLLEGSITTSDGVEVVRARALRIRATDVSGLDPLDPLPPPPEHGRADDYFKFRGPRFATEAMEIRFVEGAFLELGPGTAWFRLRHPLVAGEELSPLQRLAASADFGSGISSAVSWDQHLFINPDLTLYIEREPTGDWICLQSQTRVVRGGIGLAESVLFDERGRVGRAVQALLVAARS
jgi:hypothetical protein